MPKVSAEVLDSVIGKDGKFLAKIQLNGKLPRKGEKLMVKWGANRTLSQNSFLWVFYGWLINEAGLKDIGHFSATALHENLKEHFKQDTTTNLNKCEFSDWLEKVNQLMIDFFHIDTAPFFREYENTYMA